MNGTFSRILEHLVILIAMILCVRYVFLLFFPLLLGSLLAFAAEPIVGFIWKKLRLPRAAASGIGVAMAFSALSLAVLILCGLVLRQLGQLSGILPQAAEAARGGLSSISEWLTELAYRAPKELQAPLIRHVHRLFSDGSALLKKGTDYLLSFASLMLSQVPESILSLGTGILTSFMISIRLPKIRSFLMSHKADTKAAALLGFLTEIRQALGSWLAAQVKLSGITFLLLAVGLLLMQIPLAPLLAGGIAFLDAFPILGTGTVLIPWSIVSILGGRRLRGYGLLGIYGIVTLARTILEPRFLGKQLGLDPLLTLTAMYAGYQIWGLTGLVLAPMLAAVVSRISKIRPSQ